MIKRIITAAVLGLFLIPALILSDTLYYVLFITACALIGEYEMLRCLGLQKNILISAVAYFLAAAGPLAARFAVPEFGNEKFFAAAFSVLSVSAVLIFAGYTFSKGKISLEQAGASAAFCFYIAAAFTSLVLLRDIPQKGKFVFLFVFIAAWITDTFAYFTGLLFGKHKLIPEISPKKTVEGSVGGILFCTMAFVIYALIIKKIDESINPNIPMLIIGGIISSVIAQIGDLVMSAIKRTRGIKDYGKIFPGHGGVLDRFDSVIAVAVSLLFIELFTDML